MDRAVWPDARVARAASRFVALRLDLTDAEGDAEGYAQRYDVPGVPTTIVIDADGHVVDRVVGSASVDRVLAALRKAEE
jgi:thiol:disulfide interchange protein